MRFLDEPVRDLGDQRVGVAIGSAIRDITGFTERISTLHRNGLQNRSQLFLLI